MPRFIQFLQVLFAVTIGGYMGYQMVLRGIAIFDDRFAVICVVLLLLLELSLFVIYKLIETD